MAKPLQRRSSVMFQMGAAGGLTGAGGALKYRKSIAGSLSENSEKTQGQGKKPQMENTYQLEPKEEEDFKYGQVEHAIDNILRANIGDKRFDPVETPDLTKHLSTLIKQEVKDFGFNRYKLVVNVTIGQKKGQGMAAVSRCIWSDKTDNSASGSYQNKHLFCVATVHAIYFD